MNRFEAKKNSSEKQFCGEARNDAPVSDKGNQETVEFGDKDKEGEMNG